MHPMSSRPVMPHCLGFVVIISVIASKLSCLMFRVALHVSSCVTVTPFPNLLLRARRMSMPVRVEDFRLCVPVTQSFGTRSSHLALWRICAGSSVQLLDCQKTCILCNCRRALGSPPAGLFAAPREQKMCTASMDTKCPGLYS